MRWFTRRPAPPAPAAEHCCADVLAENMRRANDIERLKATVDRLSGKVRDLTKELDEARALEHVFAAGQAAALPRDAQRLIAQQHRALLAMQERLDAAEGRPGMLRMGWRTS